MNQINTEIYPHRRYNPLTEEWVLVSPHRTNRPWQGQTEKVTSKGQVKHDPICYLCPGNLRNLGQTNPKFDSVYSFVNDFSALVSDIPIFSPETAAGHPLFQSRVERGVCKVVVFRPEHHLTIAQMQDEQVLSVVDYWTEEYRALSKLGYLRHVQIFENKGAVMGCSNPHPHGQIWAQESIPNEVKKKHRSQEKYWKKESQVLLLDYVKEELNRKERVIFENDHFVALVPYWAVWPYEVLVLPKRHLPHLGQFSAEERLAFAKAYRQVAVLYDNLFQFDAPYSAGIHQMPLGNAEDEKFWQFHFIFYPPFLRSARVKKFMVGYEMLAEPQRDLTPEICAKTLRELPVIRFQES